MTENIWIALIGAVVSIVGSASLVNYRLKKLEEKVDEHNGYATKIATITTDIAVIKNDITYIKNAILRLEKGA
jgi:cell division protein FtsX